MDWSPWIGIFVVAIGAAIASWQQQKKINHINENRHKAEGEFHGRLEQTVGDIKNAVNNLPCVKDGMYFQQLGRLIEKVDKIEKITDKLMEKIH